MAIEIFQLQNLHVRNVPDVRIDCFVTYESRRQKTGLWVFRPGLTQTGLYSHRRWLEAGNFVSRKKRNCTIRVAKTKALISFAVTAKLICTIVFAYADCSFSQAAAHIGNVID